MNNLKTAFSYTTFLILFYIDMYFIVREFLLHTINESVVFLLILIIQFFLYILLYLFKKKKESTKVTINYKFLLCSIVCFFALETYEILYYLLISNHYNISIIFLLFMLIIIFSHFSFSKKIKMNRKFLSDIIVNFFSFLLPIFIIQFVFLIIASFAVNSCEVTNINRYEFVKTHYFAKEEVSSFPDKLPDDATNIVFKYYTDDLKHGYKILHLEFDSQTISNNSHHVKYFIQVEM